MIEALLGLAAIVFVFGVIAYLLVIGARDMVREMDEGRDDE